MFVYQPIFSMLQLQKDKGTYYILSWNSEGLYSSTLSPQYTYFLHSMKLFGYKIGIKFVKDPLLVEQSKNTTDIVNAYIVYELDAWPRNRLDHFTLKNCLFGATNIAKNSNKDKWVYSNYGIAFYGVFMSFGNGLLEML